jgi:hypothetical protein
MFIQVIQGKVSDGDALRSGMDRWAEELMPGAVGFLGSTAGVTDDGALVVLARFESADAARANSERPEQGAWWAELSNSLDGEATFLDCDSVQQLLDGGSDDAGFVQVMIGKSPDTARMHDLLTRHSAAMRDARPEIIGGLLMNLGEGRYVDAIYFTSEEAAREGEQKEIPADVRADIEEGMSLMGEVTYFDLRDPVLVSP